MNLLHRAGTFFFCLSCVLPSAFAQQTASPATPPLMPAPAPNAEGQPLILDVVVTGKSGKAIPGLAEKDFVVRDNGQPQKILSFRAVVGGGTASALPAEEPVKIIMIVDEVNTSFSAVAYERNEIQRVLLQNDGKLSHPVSMAFFSDTKTDIQNGFSQDGRALLAVFDEHMTALRSIRRSTGVYGAEERLQLSLKTLQMLAEKEAQDPGRKMVVWISPGWPLLSGPAIELTARQQQGVFSSIVSISTALREARITLYSIDPLGMNDAGSVGLTYYENFLKPVRKSSQTQIGDLGLQVLARQSGGLALNSNNAIADLIDRCFADADAFYTLTVAIAPSDQPNEYHAVEVKVETPGLTARTRGGYYTQPQGAPGP